MFKKLTMGLGVAIAVASAACTTEALPDGTAPVAEGDELGARDEGNAYDGWSQYTEAYYDYCGSLYGIRHGLSRSYGDSTRGGGACFVYGSNTSCSSDSTCVSLAQGTYGSSAYGYCYSGTCYVRPGAQSTYCVMDPNRSPGMLNRNDLPSVGVGAYGLGCMTKSAGPNTACGGTNPSLYMREVTSQSWWWC